MLFRMSASLIAVLIFSLSSAFAQDIEATLDTTATAIILDEKPEMSYKDSYFTSQHAILKNQISSVLLNHIKEPARLSFLRALPFVAGEVMLKFKDGLAPEFSMTDEGLSTNDEQINKLINKFDIKSMDLEIESLGIYMVRFNKHENPRLLANELSSLSSVRYAEINGVIGAGREFAIKKLSMYLYELNVGWGDCPAGCIRNNRTYIEALGGNAAIGQESVDTEFVGRAGDALPSAIQSELFID